MSAFNVTVRTGTWVVRYQAIAQTSCDAINAAIDQFGLAAISALPVSHGVQHGQV